MKLTTLTRYIYYLSVALIFFGLGANLMFLYNDFYKTIIQAEVIYLLRSQVSFEIIDTNLWQEVYNQFNNKKTSSKIEPSLKNPFLD